jgi:TPR repeat protein
MKTSEYNFEAVLDAFQRKEYERVFQVALPFAISGDPNAQCMLSLLYQHGLGVGRDVREAEEWLLKATAQNDAVAWNNLGSLYASCQSGLSRGPEAAKECYLKRKSWVSTAPLPIRPPSASELFGRK